MLCRLDTRANIRRRARELVSVLVMVATGMAGMTAIIGFTMLTPKWMVIVLITIIVVLVLAIARWVFCEGPT